MTSRLCKRSNSDIKNERGCIKRVIWCSEANYIDCNHLSSFNKQITKMILLLVSFSVSLVFFALYQALTQIFEEAKKINFAKPALTVSECRLEAANLEIHKQSRIPVLIRVYLVGIFETIYIALCKRNLFKESSVSTTPTRPINDVIQSYTANPGLAVVTGGDSGIGYEVCKGLLKAGFCVIIGNPTREMYFFSTMMRS